MQESDQPGSAGAWTVSEPADHITGKYYQYRLVRFGAGCVD